MDYQHVKLLDHKGGVEWKVLLPPALFLAILEIIINVTKTVGCLLVATSNDHNSSFVCWFDTIPPSKLQASPQQQQPGAAHKYYFSDQIATGAAIKSEVTRPDAPSVWGGKATWKLSLCILLHWHVYGKI